MERRQRERADLEAVFERVTDRLLEPSGHLTTKGLVLAQGESILPKVITAKASRAVLVATCSSATLVVRPYKPNHLGEHPAP